jgi:hypothetical protein
VLLNSFWDDEEIHHVCYTSLGHIKAVKLKDEAKNPMLVLQILTAALTISFAKANPVVVDVRNWEAPTTDGNFKRGELVAGSPASHYAEYAPRATDKPDLSLLPRTC